MRAENVSPEEARRNEEENELTAQSINELPFLPRLARESVARLNIGRGSIAHVQSSGSIASSDEPSVPLDRRFKAGPVALPTATPARLTLSL